MVYLFDCSAEAEYCIHNFTSTRRVPVPVHHVCICHVYVLLLWHDFIYNCLHTHDRSSW